MRRALEATAWNIARLDGWIYHPCCGPIRHASGFANSQRRSPLDQLLPKKGDHLRERSSNPPKVVVLDVRGVSRPASQPNYRQPGNRPPSNPNQKQPFNRDNRTSYYPHTKSNSSPQYGSKATSQRGPHPGRSEPSKATHASKQTRPPLQRSRKFIPRRGDLHIPSMISVANFARLLGVRQEVLQRVMKRAGMAELSSYQHMLMLDDASLLAMEFGYNPIVDDDAGFDIYPSPPPPNSQMLQQRPPIVTIMGHVDHGKTTLLDTLRSASVAKGEAGGITQHIGAFSVPVGAPTKGGPPKDSITFLDTPGHAAFSAMRARGARVTDIVVLVVAADDGVMPQTKEVINLIKQDSKLGVVVAITKCDKEGVDTDAIQRQLLGEGLELESFGGDIPCVEVSGLTGQGLDDLVDTISATAEVMEIRAEKDGRAHGVVIESRIQKGLGPVATVLIQRGTLKPQSCIIGNLASARVRQMTDALGTIVKAATPGMAVNVSGWKELPSSGDEVLQAEDSEIKKALVNRRKRQESLALMKDAEAINEQRRVERDKREEAERDAAYHSRTGLPLPSNLSSSMPKEPEVKELRLVIKGDVSGSVEAVTGALEGIGNHLAKVKIITSGVGDITDSDLSLAKTAGGVIIAFNVKTPKAIDVEAAAQKVPIISSPIIYRLMEEVRARVTEILPPILESKVTGEATILQLFDINIKRKVFKQVAGCRGRNGTLLKSQLIRVIRQGKTLHEGPIDSLKHLKTDIQEVNREMDFGLSLQNFGEMRVGDLLQSLKQIEVPRKL